MIKDCTINVIDLDRTLLPYDSFRALIKKELFKLDLYVIWITIIRITRLTSMDYFKIKMIKHLEKKYKDTYFNEYANILFKDLDKDVLEMIASETKNNTLTILLSASPNLFVKPLIEKLEYEGTGSYFNEKGSFVHIYGSGKIKWLASNYNAQKYNYNFAISDSNTDDELLSLFKKSVKWSKAIK